MPSGPDGPEPTRGFHLVDFAARRRPGFRNCIVPLGRVPALVRRYGAFGCYATFYLYDEAIRRHARGRGQGGRPSVAGYDGPVYAPVWPLDLDSPHLEEALRATRSLVAHLRGPWGLPEASVRAYFSGKKGFHVVVDTRAFLPPAPSLVVPELLHRLARRLAGELGFSPSGPLDLSLRDRVRLLRLPNTRHEESGLFKVPLAPGELASLPVEAILELAARPRPLAGVDPTGLRFEAAVPPAPPVQEVLEEVARGTAAAPSVPGPPEPWAEVLACPARQALLEAPCPAGQRNNTAIRLASWLREAGWGPEAVEARLAAWNRANPVPLDGAEVRHVVSSAFSPLRPYRYGCRDPLVAPLCPGDPAERRGCPYHRGGRGAP